MAGPKSVQLLESVYVRTDKQVREILDAWENPDIDDFIFLMGFDGGGAALVAGMNGSGEIPDDGRIIGARLYVGRIDLPCDAVVTVWLGSFADYPIGAALHGIGIIPTLTSADPGKIELDITGWQEYVHLRDMLTWELTSFTGTAQHLTLSLLVKKLPRLGVRAVVDSTGEGIVTNDGETIILR